MKQLIADLRARLAATVEYNPGPWADVRGPDNAAIEDKDGEWVATTDIPETRELIVTLRNSVEELLDYVEKLEAALEPKT